jgi:hypothetical protein
MDFAAFVREHVFPPPFRAASPLSPEQCSHRIKAASAESRKGKSRDSLRRIGRYAIGSRIWLEVEGPGRRNWAPTVLLVRISPSARGSNLVGWCGPNPINLAVLALIVLLVLSGRLEIAHDPILDAAIALGVLAFFLWERSRSGPQRVSLMAFLTSATKAQIVRPIVS